jgi:hypothetical protein
MSRENPPWAASRIHGELLKLAIDISETSIGKYMARRHKPLSQTWRTFLENHVKTVVSIDFFTVPTIRFRGALPVSGSGSRSRADCAFQYPNPSDGRLDMAATAGGIRVRSGAKASASGPGRNICRRVQ